MNNYKLAIDFAQDLLANHLDSNYVYHNYQHTLNVVKAAYIVGFHSNLQGEQFDLLLISAWFHDVGYCVNHENHEEHSAEIVRKVLPTLDFSYDQIQAIEHAILSTAMPQNPKTELAKILCDADLYHLSQPDFQANSSMLRKELAITRELHFSDREWDRCNRQFLSQHRYQSVYGKKQLESLKKNNLYNLSVLTE